MTLSSAIGGAQYCHESGLYRSANPVYEDSFYRMATIMRPLANLPQGDSNRDLALAGFLMYETGYTQGTHTETVYVDSRFKMTPNKITEPAQCQKLERMLLDARKPGRLLDVAPSKPILPGQPT